MFRRSLTLAGRGLAASRSRTLSSLSFLSEDHAKVYDHSTNDPERFWGDLARERIDWHQPFNTAMNCDMNAGKIRWFEGGKLNVCENVVDRHARLDPNRIAFIWEKDEPGDVERVSYGDLLESACRIGNALRARGIQRGDRVAIYMPVSPLAAASMLACARIGAVHSVVFAGFSAEALRNRIRDAEAKAVITADEGVRGGKRIPLKSIVDAALDDGACPTVGDVFVMTRTGSDVKMMHPRDVKLEEAMSEQPPTCPAESMDSEDLLYLLYTSGSTGRPKGIAHTQAGYLLYTGVTHQNAFDVRSGDIFACVADIGWITGHSHALYGPLFNGVTSVLFESVPTYPNPGRYWEMVQRLRVTQIYTAPTALRLLIKSGDSHVRKYDRSSLRILGCVGEPLNVEAWHWYHTVVGERRCTVVDTWWQTETGGIMLSPRPAPTGTQPKPGFPMLPFPGIRPLLVDSNGAEIVGNDVSGLLCIRGAWPGMARTIYGDHERFLNTYFRPYPGLYFTGDGAYRDVDGHYRITGRVDDVINVKGHRLGTAEVESALDEHPDVAEAAVVGFPHEVYGEGIYAYVILKDTFAPAGTMDDIVKSMKGIVKSKIGSFAVPEIVLVTPGLPKTRSGKIMRRILRKVAANQTDDLGDVSTLADPAVVEEIKSRHVELMKEREYAYGRKE
ncbi:acetyl-coenzyme A synthetase 2-like, mitochondrial [Oscarella lobularis]|uniref:acetyl-coenzyme A synthetase 2-like, mitochondrial n=1 Tax=Oscarella lobularis TaxID=121494 RepID=UPI0033133372